MDGGLGINGRLSYALPVAFNDELGKWTVAVTDIACGRQEQVSFTVTPRKP